MSGNVKSMFVNGAKSTEAKPKVSPKQVYGGSFIPVFGFLINRPCAGGGAKGQAAGTDSYSPGLEHYQP